MLMGQVRHKSTEAWKNPVSMSAWFGMCGLRWSYLSQPVDSSISANPHGSQMESRGNRP